MSGWDTPGHVVLAKEFAKIIESGVAIGWSDVWFGGFPVFYFYPPFYYFLVYGIHSILLIPIEFAFSISVFITICFLGFSIYQFGNQFFWKRYPLQVRLLLGMISILFYFNYAGEGLQGTSIVGIIEGTVISSFTHALFFFAVIIIDRYRIDPNRKRLIAFVSLSALVFYSHLLSSIFYLLILFVYFVVYRNFWIQHKRILVISLFSIFILILPVLYNFFRYSEYTSSVFYGYSYPPILSILSRDVYDKAFKASQSGENLTLAFVIELLRSGRWLYLFILIALTFQLRNLQNNLRSRFITIVLLIFFWMSLDYSFGYIIPNIKIHNYRAFDTFFIAVSILTPFLIVFTLRIQKQLLPLVPSLFFILITQVYLFIIFDPFRYQEYNSPLWKEARSKEELQLYDRLTFGLKTLPPNSIVQPEIIKSKAVFGSPHFWIPLFYQSGIKNNLGLTVESSYYSTLVFNWQSFGFVHSFRWGTDIDWRDSLVYLKGNNDPGYYLDFLLRSGVQYLMGFSPDFNEYIDKQRNRLSVFWEEGPFKIVKVLPNKNTKYVKPIGLLHADTLNQNKEYGYQSFLRTSNLLQMYLSNLGYQTKIIRINRENISSLDLILPDLSALILISNDNQLGEQSWLQGLEKKGKPGLLLVDSSITSSKMQTERSLELLLKELPKTQNEQYKTIGIQSYFSAKNFENGIILLDDSAKEFQIPLRPESQNVNYITNLSPLSGKIYLGFMLFCFVLFCVVSVLTKIAYFSFSNAKK
ncbi:hypothetical protein [Leptospira paudalimensis]|uniref:Membrane protein 6-pyruvoyl-tetrahydropterin synthase-related domain-containing protein n=1 Tax=Leptospira paudalimensis TaxID=2950024 RepID=A0ABT3M4G6_9LEPT|nr:hypothetical protein [Leptospira paudalimensis]MCW7503276.1 hypothetical protein [Leptospira paudalimensis]